MPTKPNEDDLFKDTTMTFGEHLEELRTCLVRAVLGLAIGFLIGLYFADMGVKFILGPLESSLKDYYARVALKRVTETLDSMRHEGVPVPPIAEVRDAIEKDGLVPQLQYWDPVEINQQMRRMYPDRKALYPSTGDWALRRHDLPDLQTFVEELSDVQETSKPAARVWTALPEDIRKAAAGGNQLTEPQQQQVVAALNTAIAQRDLFRKGDFVELDQDPDLASLVDQLAAQPADEAPRINRQILSHLYGTDEGVGTRIRRENLLRTWIWVPVSEDPRTRPKTLSVHEMFAVWVKAGLVLGAVISSPWVFLQIWNFVAAGLYPHEKRYVNVFLPFSLGLFLLGAATAFFFVFQPVLEFLLTFNEWMGVDPDIRISEWLSFALFLPIGFGVSFQLPLVMLFLERIGIFDVPTYWEKRKVAILVIFILSMFLTPADPYSMLLMALPLTLLYFLGMGLCMYMPKGHNPFDEPDEV